MRRLCSIQLENLFERFTFSECRQEFVFYLFVTFRVKQGCVALDKTVANLTWQVLNICLLSREFNHV